MKKNSLSLIFLSFLTIFSVAACDSFNFDAFSNQDDPINDVDPAQKDDDNNDNKEDKKENEDKDKKEEEKEPEEEKKDEKIDSGDERWNIDLSKFGVDFRNALGSLITAKVASTTTYKNCLNIGKTASAIGTKFVPFYHGSDYTVSNDVSCNREHTWPNSRGGGDKNGGSNIEADPFMVRPTITQDNSDRGNNFYGIPGSKINGTAYSNQWDPGSCGFEGARGESARIIFYVATKYGASNNLKLTNNPSDASSERSMGVLKYLVQWNKQYPVTDMEIQINDYLDSKGYGRNPFVDHPEYVDYIWNEDGIVTSLPEFKQSTPQESPEIRYSIYDAYDDIRQASQFIF